MCVPFSDKNIFILIVATLGNSKATFATLTMVAPFGFEVLENVRAFCVHILPDAASPMKNKGLSVVPQP